MAQLGHKLAFIGFEALEGRGLVCQVNLKIALRCLSWLVMLLRLVSWRWRISTGRAVLYLSPTPPTTASDDGLVPQLVNSLCTLTHGFADSAHFIDLLEA